MWRQSGCVAAAETHGMIQAGVDAAQPGDTVLVSGWPVQRFLSFKCKAVPPAIASMIM